MTSTERPPALLEYDVAIDGAFVGDTYTDPVAAIAHAAQIRREGHTDETGLYEPGVVTVVVSLVAVRP